jgi:hypothetical protein
VPEEAQSDTESENKVSETESGVRRRRLLRTGVNVGVTGALVLGFGANYVSSGDLDTITYAMARPERGASSLEPRTKEVPVAWHESLRLAFQVQEKIRSSGLSPVKGSFIVPGSYDDPEASISVEATDSSVTDPLGNLTEGVPVDVSIIEDIPPKSDSELDVEDAYQVSELDPERIPGGVVCKAEDKIGTLTPALFDAESGSRFFATSNHVFGAAGTKETEHQGEPLALLHEDTQHRIGTVERGYPEVDLGQVTPRGQYEPSTEIERASPSRVIGQFTKTGLADLSARGKSLRKIGALSDETAGRVKGIDGVTCYTGEVCKPGQLKWGDEEALVDGDSGSVNFRADPENPDEYLLVGGINNARTWWPGANFAWGTAAHHLSDEYGFHF